MKATSPGGETYVVTRRWLPWRRKAKDLEPSWDLPLDGGVDDLGILGIVLLTIVLILAAPFIVAALVVAIELALLLLLLPFYVVARILFGVTWEVEVHRREGFFSHPLVHTEKVAGWGASGARITEIASAVRDGRAAEVLRPTSH